MSRSRASANPKSIDAGVGGRHFATPAPTVAAPGLTEWEATGSYPKGATVVYNNKLYLAEAYVPPGVAPGNTITATQLLVGTQRSVMDVGAVVGGHSDLENFPGDAPQGWVNGDYFELNVNEMVPYTVARGLFAGMVFNQQVGRVYLVDQANPVPALRWRVVEGPGAVGQIQVWPGGLTSGTNPWRVELASVDAYTKLEVDNKIDAAVLGLIHGMAVQAIVNDPPTTPVADEAYIVGTVPTGGFVGHANELTFWDGKAWLFSPPQDKESHLVEDQNANFSWNGTAWVKVASGSTSAAAASGDLYQVGSIQQSLLTETQWATLLGAESSKWVLADGRNVAGSKYTQVTGQNNVPDLRGAFVRAAGQNSNSQANWNGGTVGSRREDTTRRPRNTNLTGTTSNAGSHHHDMYISDTNNGSAVYSINTNGTQVDNAYLASGNNMWFAWGGSRKGQKNNLLTDAGDHNHNVTINNGGDTETAPVHVALNTFIKIN